MGVVFWGSVFVFRILLRCIVAIFHVHRALGVFDLVVDAVVTSLSSRLSLCELEICSDWVLL